MKFYGGIRGGNKKRSDEILVEIRPTKLTVQSEIWPLLKLQTDFDEIATIALQWYKWQ